MSVDQRRSMMFWGGSICHMANWEHSWFLFRSLFVKNINESMVIFTHVYLLTEHRARLLIVSKFIDQCIPVP